MFKKYKTPNKVKIRVIKSKKNLGKGYALKLGVQNAKHDWILTADIDQSVPLSQICKWLEKKLVNNKYLVYFGSRTHKKSVVKRDLFRKLLGDIMSLLVITILGIKYFDTQCGYKLYKKSLAKIIFSKIKSFGFEHDLEIVLLLKLKKIDIKELPVKWIHKKNSSLNILIDPIKMFFGIFVIRFRF